MKALCEKGIEGFSESSKAQLLNVMLDLVNVLRHKSEPQKMTKDDTKKSLDILPKEIAMNRESIANLVVNYISHSVQLVDIKSLSWIFSEKPKIKSLLYLGQTL